jgi:hypothetical protein
MLIVFRTEIKIANQSTFAYTANEVDSDGNSINYLSGAQLAELIGESPKGTVPSRMSQDLKAALGKDFTTIPGKTKTSQNNYIKVSLWDTFSCTQFIGYHATRGNQQAVKLLITLAVTSLDIIINDAFDREYKKGQAEELHNTRMNGKIVRRTLTEAIQDYLKNHNVSENTKNHIYSNVTDAINRAIFNRRSAKQLREDWGVDNPRDYMNQAELQLISEVENLSTRLIDKDQLEPMVAVKEAIARLCLPTIKR